MYTFIYSCEYTVLCLNALRYHPKVSKATDKQETNNYLVLCCVEKKRQTDSMYPFDKLCSQNNFWVVCWNVKELQIKKNNAEIMHTGWVEVTKKAM